MSYAAIKSDKDFDESVLLNGKDVDPSSIPTRGDGGI